MTEPHREQAWRRLAKARVDLARSFEEPCGICGGAIDYALSGRAQAGATADHPHMIQLGGELLPPLEELRVAHRSCNSRQGGQVQGKIRAARRKQARRLTIVTKSENVDEVTQRDASPNVNARENVTVGEGDPGPVSELSTPTPRSLPAFTPLGSPSVTEDPRGTPGVMATEGDNPSRARRGSPRVTLGRPLERPPWWPDYLSTPPPDATLPRLETPHHSSSTGSYGNRVIAHALTYGVRLRWWQAYAVTRILEHDRHGRLLWEEAAVSVVRQVGKGYGGIRPLAEWRMHSADLFGEPQTVLHLGHQVNVVMEIATPSIARHRALGNSVRMTNGEQSITLPDGSRWLMRSTTGAYGFSVSMPLVDEVWAVAPRVLDSMVSPTMIERAQPQLVLWSTANAEATPTYPRFVSGAGELEGRLVLEWSPEPAAARADPGDRRLWRAAAPHWSDQRERMMVRQLSSSSRADFLANWLNVWPEVKVISKRTERAMPGWDALRTAPPAPARGGIVAIDEARDASRYGCLRLVADCVYYSEHSTLAGAVALAGGAEHVVVGVSLAEAAAKAGLRHHAIKYGSRQTALYTPLLTQVVRSGRLAHDYSPELLAQAEGTVTLEGEGGRSINARSSSSDVLGPKLLAWCLGLDRSIASSRPAIW